METITLQIGHIVTGNSGQSNDTRRDVQFKGEEIASRTEYGTNRNGGITDTRGVTQTLYKTEDGRLIVYIEEWSQWRGEPSVYSLQEVTADDLQPGERFDELGAETDDYGRALTLDEALDVQGEN